MPTDHRTVLAKIKRFDQLIAYLRDEMGWPIARDSFEDVDDLFYDFTADELGIDPKTAAKIDSIKRLRPLSPRQPWGIFFVKFEPKKLPVVALRRILSQVALKKRASANSAERTAWAADDLLFVSNYGEGEERQISFAHFSKAPDSHDLPTLKVLGWDNLDTALRLDAVAKELTQHLAWPEDEKDIDAWRERWRAAFTLGHREVVTTSKELSIRLAELARAIRDRIKTALAIETERGPLTKLMKAFKEALVHDLDAHGFADMYAQTIAYGLLSARIANPHEKTADDFAGHMRTNPFLRELMETFLKIGGRRGKAGGPGIDFDELGVSEVVELLDDANMEAVVLDFGDRNPQEDPVIHFYELFLKEYDAKKRMQRGVFYTPRPVVSYIVRSVDELLRTEFGLEDGLADTTTWAEIAKRNKDLVIPEGASPEQAFIQILDPATGTGTFLVEVIDLIHKTLVAKWKAQRHDEKKIEGLWNEYVPKHLLSRLHGYELLMAPYAIAHLKIGLKLHETGYRFGSDERAHIYLTNALEPAPQGNGQMQFKELVPALAHEAQAVNEVKGRQRFTVVIGNPPYSKLSANLSEQARAIVNAYKEVAGEKIVEKGALQFEMNLQDDYVKFVRIAEQMLRRSSWGIVGMITNSGYLANPTLRGMRWSLCDTFSRIDVLNLNGHNSSNRNEINSGDENVFDIQQGVAIALLRRLGKKGNGPTVSYGSLSGPRDDKYQTLVTYNCLSVESTPIAAEGPLYKFIPSDSALGTEFSSMVSLPELFPRNSAGFITSRDGLVVDQVRATLEQRIETFGADKRPPHEIYAAYNFQPSKRLELREAQSSVCKQGDVRSFIRACLYRPFDPRWVYYTRDLIESYKPIAGNMLLANNLALLATRQVTGRRFEHAFIARTMIEIKACSHDRNTQIFPLFVTESESGVQPLLRGHHRAANVSERAVALIASSTGLAFTGTKAPPGTTSYSAEDVFYYTYAVLHSTAYRDRYFEFLKSEFPRIPMTVGGTLFRELARLGAELGSLHLLESARLNQPITTYAGPTNPEVRRVGWSDDTVWLDAAATKKGQPATPGSIGFHGVPEAVWDFHIGGYQVCEKWLKDRKGRTLTRDDIAHYQKIVVALAETIRLMQEIDEVIEQHGGWPGAFSAPKDEAERHRGVDAAVPSLPLSSEDREEYQFPEARQPKAAERTTLPYGSDEETPSAEARHDFERDELICMARQLFSDGETRHRDIAIKELARDRGYQRTDSRTLEELDSVLRAAVRRGILANEESGLALASRTIADYERDFLKDQFIASLQGRAWAERDDAIRTFARWLGFRRTGAAIDETARSLINGLIREGRLETEGSQVRRCG